VTFSVSVQAGTMILGDYTGDRKTDAAIPCCTDFASLWLGTTGTSFATSTFRPSPGYGITLGSWHSGDFNGDGRLDLAHLCCNDYMNTWLSRGDGSFDVRPFGPGAGYWLQGGFWRSGDINGDGRTDLIHFLPGDYIRPWLSNGDGSFTVGFFSPGAGYWIQGGAWHVGDFNGDVKTDFIHLLPGDSVRPWLSNGNGSFTVGHFSPWPGYWIAGGSWRTGDFNGDGRSDLLHQLPSDHVRPWLSNGDGSFNVGFFSPGGGYWIQGGSWIETDLNADRKTDLVHLLPADYVRTWIARGDGSFSIGFFSPRPGYLIQSGSWHAGDFNADGRTDLMHRCCHFVNIWRSDGTGAFAVDPFNP
jgi:hypothetical protein